ncbi:MAG: hypothetical protein IT576_20460 [Verrucomicrobiales bacterium]|nr:hypothetical protein [Verrucomicrobiales bacterium]
MSRVERDKTQEHIQFAFTPTQPRGPEAESHLPALGWLHHGRPSLLVGKRLNQEKILENAWYSITELPQLTHEIIPDHDYNPDLRSCPQSGRISIPTRIALVVIGRFSLFLRWQHPNDRGELIHDRLPDHVGLGSKNLLKLVQHKHRLQEIGSPPNVTRLEKIPETAPVPFGNIEPNIGKFGGRPSHQNIEGFLRRISKRFAGDLSNPRPNDGTAMILQPREQGGVDERAFSDSRVTGNHGQPTSQDGDEEFIRLFGAPKEDRSILGFKGPRSRKAIDRN